MPTIDPFDSTSTFLMGSSFSPSSPRSPSHTRNFPSAIDRGRASFQPTFQPMSFRATVRSSPTDREPTHDSHAYHPLGISASPPQLVAGKGCETLPIRMTGQTNERALRPLHGGHSKSETRLVARLANTHLSPPKFNPLGQTLSPPNLFRTRSYRGSVTSPSSPTARSPVPYARGTLGTLGTIGSFVPPTPGRAGGNMPLPIMSMSSSLQHGAQARSRMGLSPGGSFGGRMGRFGIPNSQAEQYGLPYGGPTGTMGGVAGGMLGLASMRSNRGLVPPGAGSGAFLQGRQTPTFIRVDSPEGRLSGSRARSPAGDLTQTGEEQSPQPGALINAFSMPNTDDHLNGLPGIGGSWGEERLTGSVSLSVVQTARPDGRGALQMSTPAIDAVTPWNGSGRRSTGAAKMGQTAKRKVPGGMESARPQEDVVEGYPFTDVIPSPIARETRREALGPETAASTTVPRSALRTLGRNVFGLSKVSGSGTGTPSWAGKADLEGYKLGVAGNVDANLAANNVLGPEGAPKVGASGFRRPSMAFEGDGAVSPGTVVGGVGSDYAGITSGSEQTRRKHGDHGDGKTRDYQRGDARSARGLLAG